MPACLWFCWVSVKAVIAATVATATIVSGFAAALAAYYARETARVVFVVEQQRLIQEKNKNAADMYQRYVDFIRQTAPVRPCLAALKDLDDQEFVTLLTTPEAFEFSAGRSTHVALAQCLQQNEQRAYYSKTPTAWKTEQSVAVRGTIVIWLNQLDAYFLVFELQVGNPGILCGNMLRLVGAAPQVSAFNDLLMRMNAAKLLEDEEHLKRFLEKHGVRKAPCPPIEVAAAVPPGFAEQFIDWLNTHILPLIVPDTKPAETARST